MAKKSRESFLKRQRELARRDKREKKLQKRKERREGTQSEQDETNPGSEQEPPPAL